MERSCVNHLKYVVLQGNYDAYVQTRMELEENQMKRYKWEQDQIAHMKVIIDSVDILSYHLYSDSFWLAPCENYAQILLRMPYFMQCASQRTH